MAKVTKRQSREFRKARIRKKIMGTTERPRLCVFKSNNNMSAQIIDDLSHKTLVSASTAEKSLKANLKSGGNIEAAKLIGKTVAERALKNNVENLVFDRSGFNYHGRVKVLAEAAREAGLKF